MPTPSRHSARIAFELPRGGAVRLVIRDIAGRTVRTLADADYPAGRSDSIWNGERDGDSPAESGIYFTELEFGGARVTRRICWMR